ncbi:MAG: benzoate-CoA ligase family protein [Deltaproteobacteria bacterium]|nr:benzoate-CoA ligase family protein [Deltaproteobacteria bacterium]
MSDDVRFDDDLNLADYFVHDRVREGRGDRVAIRFGDARYSYRQVSERSTALASSLRTHGVKPEQRVLVILPDLPAFAWAIFGTMECGAVLAMGNPDAPSKDLAYLLAYTRATALITVPRVLAAIEAEVLAAGLCAVYLAHDAPTSERPDQEVTLPTLPEVTVLALEHEVTARWPAMPRVKTRRDDVAIWLFTSGSTGQSKAAMHTHRDFAFNTEVFAKETMALRESDVTVSVPRLYFGYATGTNLFFPFAVGATAALFSERPTPEALLDAIARDRPTVLTNVPTMMGRLLAHDRERQRRGESALDLSCLRFCYSAGEALPPSLLAQWSERFGVEVYDGIGSAEMFHIYVSNRPGDVMPGSLGRVVSGYTARLLAQDAEGPGAPEVPEGQEGVLWIRGDSVALGYFQDRDKSWETFHGHWCRTGDLFRRDAQGYFWFGGRADELLKISGQWVSPIEVEECLLSHPAVQTCALIGVDLGGGMLASRMYVVLHAGHIQDDTLAVALQDHVRARLSHHKYPRQVRFVDELPRNDRGKIDRKALKARASES